MSGAAEEEVHEEGAAAAPAAAEIFPGLPDDVGLRCLAFVSRLHHHTLRQVCTRWRDLISKGLTSFHALRRSLGLTSDFPVLLTSNYSLTSTYRCSPHQITFSEIHLSSPTPSVRTVIFSTSEDTVSTPPANPVLDSDDEVDPYGGFEDYWDPAHIPLGPFLLVLGGISRFNVLMSEPEASNRLDIFDISAGVWRCGASMLSPRRHFAWGVIDNLLYVAGGMTNEGTGDNIEGVLTDRAEVYDLEADSWTPIASMPADIHIEFSYVHKQVLFVGGYTFDSWVEEYVEASLEYRLVSYTPSVNQWKEEKRHPETFCDPFSYDQICKKMTAVQDCEATGLYLLDVEEDRTWDVTQNDFKRDWKVLTFDQETSTWRLVYQVSEYAEDCYCSTAFNIQHTNFVSIGKKPIVLTHPDREEAYEADVHRLKIRDVEVGIGILDDVLRVSVPCAQGWRVVVVNA